MNLVVVVHMCGSITKAADVAKVAKERKGEKQNGKQSKRETGENGGKNRGENEANQTEVK